MPILGAVAVAAAAFAGTPGAPDAAAAGPAQWVRPVPGAVVRPFAPPAHRYGPGHLGADLAAPPGTPVRAVGGGTVVFAGAVAGGLHVVVRHANGWRTTYAFLASVTVTTGAAVAAGAVVGTAGGTGEQHDGTVVHLGLRIGDDYADPMALFAPDLTALVHLAPTGRAPAGDERAALAAGLVVARDESPPGASAEPGFVDNPVLCPRPAAAGCDRHSR